MKFLELSPGISVNVDSIDVITRHGEGTIVHMADESWETAIPYEVFKKLLVRHMSDGGIARNIKQLAAMQTSPTP